jgi:hypothetical protein
MGLPDVFQSIQKKLNFRKVVEISGIKFELGILTFEEELKSESFPQGDTDPLAYYNETRRYTLSHAIKGINGETVTEVVEVKNGDKTDKIQGSLYVKNLLSTLPVKMIEQLFDAYIDIKDEFESMLDKDLKYNWFKNPEQREEERKNKSSGSTETPKPEEKPADDTAPIKFTEIPKPPEDDKE